MHFVCVYRRTGMHIFTSLSLQCEHLLGKYFWIDYTPFTLISAHYIAL